MGNKSDRLLALEAMTGAKSMWNFDFDAATMRVLDDVNPRRCFHATVGEKFRGPHTIHEVKARSHDEAWRIARNRFGANNVRAVGEVNSNTVQQIIDYSTVGETKMPHIVAQTADQYIAEETAQKTAAVKARAVEALALFLKAQEAEKARLKGVIENTKKARAKVKDALKAADGIRDRADASVADIKAYLKDNDPNFIASYW